MASIRKRGKTYSIRYKDEAGKSVERKGAPSKKVAQEIANEAADRVARIKAGLVNPKMDRYAMESGRPIKAHLDDFAKYLADKGGDPKHARMKAERARRLLVDLAGVKTLGGVTMAGVQGAIAKLNGDGLSIQTQNHYLDSAKMFCHWCIRDGRAVDSPIQFMSRRSPLADLRRVRRALTPDECVRLIRATATAPEIIDVPAADRVALYMVAIGTGFRVKEIKRLVPEGFSLDGDRPTITVEPAKDRKRKTVTQPIAPELAAHLREWIARKPPGEKLFPIQPEWFAPILRTDLGIAGIPAATPEGLIDFHALRATYVTHLIQSGASVKESQTLARHSTPVLTIQIYAKVSPEDISNAVRKLPDLSLPKPEEPKPEDEK